MSIATGTWKDKIQPASFKGVPFGVSSDKGDFGRRIVRHDFINSRDPYIEDIGLAAREFTIDAYILGDDYMTIRDRLIAKCEESGPGVLVHPWYGKIYVSLLGKAIVSHASADGRMCVVSFQVVRVGETPVSVQADNGMVKTVTAAGAALNAVNTGFAKAFEITGQISYVVDSAREKITAALNTVSDIKAQARKLAEFNQKIGAMVSDINTLMLAPGDLVNALHDVLSFNFGGGTLTNPYNLTAKIDDFYELRKLFIFGDDDVFSDGESPSVLTEVANSESINSLVKISAIVMAARVVVDLEFKNYNEAIKIRGIIIDAIDGVMETTSDDDLFLSLIELKSQVVKNIEAKSQGLSALQSIALVSSIPSLVLAYNLYGNLDLEQDVIDRNNVRVPAMVPGGVPLEVLSEQ